MKLCDYFNQLADYGPQWVEAEPYAYIEEVYYFGPYGDGPIWS